MKTATQSSADLIHLSTILEHFPVAMLTHLENDGAMVSRPMSPLEMDGSGAFWFLTARRTVESQDLSVLNLSFTDAAHAVYVSLSGRGEVSLDTAQIKRLWSPFARPWFPDGPESENVALLKFIPETAEYWDAPHSKMVRLFAMAASIAARRPIGLGVHDSHTDLSKRPAARVINTPMWRYTAGS
jgi:general stress protein 26